MCDCINKLVEKGYVERQTVYENQDFVDQGYMIRKYQQRASDVVATNQCFHLNYCPACGKKLEIILKEKENDNR